jgi:hypothetical protein
MGYTGGTTDPDAGYDWIGIARIEAQCGALALDGSSVVVSPGVTLPQHGGWPGPGWEQQCPPDQVVVGFSGRSGQYVDQIGFQCGQWVTSTNVQGDSLSMNATTTLPLVGGDGGTPFSVACPVGQMAIGSALRSGFWLDSFSLVCGTPALEWDAGP